MEWHWREGQLQARVIEYTVQAKYYCFQCLHGGEPRLLKRETLRLSRDSLQPEQVETLNPGFEAVDLALAASHERLPRAQGLVVATEEQMRELERLDLRGDFPRIRAVAEGYEVESRGTRQGGGDPWVSGNVTLLVLKKGDSWRLDAIRFEPDRN